MKSARFVWRLIAAPGLLLLVLVSFVVWHEWYTIGVIADPDVIAGYYFGSEAMMHHGGEHYASAETYSRAMLLSGLLIAPGLIAFIIAAAKGYKRYTLLSYVIFALVVGINWLL